MPEPDGLVTGLRAETLEQRGSPTLSKKRHPVSLAKTEHENRRVLFSPRSESGPLSRHHRLQVRRVADQPATTSHTSASSRKDKRAIKNLANLALFSWVFFHAFTPCRDVYGFYSWCYFPVGCSHFLVGNFNTSRRLRDEME